MSRGKNKKFEVKYLPSELRSLVHVATEQLGDCIRQLESDRLYKKIEKYRRSLKKARRDQAMPLLKSLISDLGAESREDLHKIVHAFSLQLELTNACETAYRTWFLRQSEFKSDSNRKMNLTYVLTAHPTEARSRSNVDSFNRLVQILIEQLSSRSTGDSAGLAGAIALLWKQPLAKAKSPSVVDEAEYIFSLLFSEDIFDFILSEKADHELRLRTWVGGDKDGHPGVDSRVMCQCLEVSRRYLIERIQDKLTKVLKDIEELQQVGEVTFKEVVVLKKLKKDLGKLRSIRDGDGNRIQRWKSDFECIFKSESKVISRLYPIHLISRILEMFPALVVAIELREDSDVIAEALKDKKAAICGMLMRLSRIAVRYPVTHYARALVISHCETAENMSQALRLVKKTIRYQKFPIVPLFESREALIRSTQILTEWFSNGENLKRVRKDWGSKFEVMLGYSDSAKQIGSLASRFQIKNAMIDIEKTLKRFQVQPIFFHGSGGSVARGGGSLREQISWWSSSAIESPKMTIQGEMIQRLFATKEIFNSQNRHLINEMSNRKREKTASPRALQELVERAEGEYAKVVQDQELLTALLNATPYRYLEVLKIGSRPSKRPSNHVTVSSLRAIPWVLCWTQTRILLPTWWGVGSAWEKATLKDKKQLKNLFKTDPFFSSFAKMLGFTLAKVELEVWHLYLKRQGRADLLVNFEHEYRKSVQFLRQVSGKKSLIWYRPWLEESIRMRSPVVHLLNVAQLIAMDRNDEALLRETLVGISSGMLTTG